MLIFCPPWHARSPPTKPATTWRYPHGSSMSLGYINWVNWVHLSETTWPFGQIVWTSATSQGSPKQRFPHGFVPITFVLCLIESPTRCFGNTSDENKTPLDAAESHRIQLSKCREKTTLRWDGQPSTKKYKQSVEDSVEDSPSHPPNSPEFFWDRHGKLKTLSSVI